MRQQFAAVLALAAAGAFLVGPARAATQYVLDLDPVAYDASTRANVAGQGHLTARLDGDKLTINGNFSGLAANATVAHLGIGLAKGVPADSDIAKLTISPATSGTVSGTASLTAAQAAGVARGGLFVQIDIAKGGALWGWFEPVRAH